MFLLEQILPAVILAMIVGGAICGAGFFWATERVQRAVVPLACGVGYFCGHFLITGWVRMPPADTTNWLPYFALVAAALSALLASLTLPTPARLLLYAGVCVAALRLLLAPQFRYTWSFWEGWMWVASLGLGSVVMALILEVRFRSPATAGEMPAVLVVISVGASIALMLSGSMLLGQFAAVLAGSGFGTLLFALRRPALGGGISPVFSLLFVALLLCGYFFAELPRTSAVLLGSAPALVLLPITMKSEWQTSASRAGLVSIPAVAALIFAWRASPPLYY